MRAAFSILISIIGVRGRIDQQGHTDALWVLSQAGLWGWAALRWIVHHTGLPVILVAAILLVASTHVLKRTLHFAFEVLVAAGLLLVATRLGWIVW